MVLKEDEKIPELIPTSVLTLVLDQMKETSEEQVSASKEMVKAIGEVATAITYPPTRKDLAAALADSHKLIDENNRIMSDLKKDIEEDGGIKSEIREMTDAIRSLKNTVKVWITVISTVISIAVGGYALFSKSVDTQVQNYVNKAVETIVKSRPSNEWPPQGSAADEDLPPHLHGSKGEIIILPDKAKK